MDRLLEREREAAAVQQLVERGGGVLLIEGRAGIGKTSLLEVASRRAQDLKREVLSARGSELEADFPFGVVRQLFERRLAGRQALFAGAYREALAGTVDEHLGVVEILAVGRARTTIEPCGCYGCWPPSWSWGG